jgi:hypothetical protein
VSGSIRIIKRSIRAILHTETASSADRGHALPEGGKTAIRRTSKGAAIVCAPRIILGFGPCSYSDNKNENPQYEDRYSHDCLLLAAVSPRKRKRRNRLTVSTALPITRKTQGCAGRIGDEGKTVAVNPPVALLSVA